MDQYSNQDNLPFVQAATVAWNKDHPSSKTHDDHYFSVDDGLGESRHVFIEGAELESHWNRAIVENRQITTIFELGFGSGLNFLASAEHFSNYRRTLTDPGGLTLRYFSIEKHPMTRRDAERATKQWQANLSLRTRLFESLPPRIRGQHQIVFEDINIELILLYDDARTALAQLVVQDPFIDAVFLDGFAPPTNAAMWQFGVLQRLAELSRPGATLATFSAASAVRRNLQRIGYNVEKCPGFGRKREMLRGRRPATLRPRKLRDRTPWYSLPPIRRPRRVAIIGAGLAGTASAHSLASRGIACTIFDAAENVATAASQVPVAGWFPQLTVDFDRRSEILWQACQHLERFLESRKAKGDAPHSAFDLNGCFFVADTPERQRRLQSIEAIVSKCGIPVRFLSQDDARTETGANLRWPGLDCRLGGSVEPLWLCQSFTEHPLIELKFKHAVDRIEFNPVDQLWCVVTNSGDDDTEAAFDAVILATGADTRIAASFDIDGLNKSRGQVTWIDNPHRRNQRRLICYKGFLNTPLGDRTRQIAGATVERLVDDEYPNGNAKSANLHNLALLDSVVDNVATNSGQQNFESWTGTRLHSRDRLPLLGPVPKFETLRHSLNASQNTAAMRDFVEPEYHPGLFVNIAHGSRGASTALLCGTLLGEMMTGEPLSLPKQLLTALHPGRFMVRSMRTESRSHAST